MEQVIVFDMDGVLADVSGSYREAIVQTVRHFTGQSVAPDVVQRYKNQAGWNNDWALSQKIIADFGQDIELSAVVAYFNEIFLGPQRDGLIMRERWLPAEGVLERLSTRYALAIFTGRMRYELEPTLQRFARDVRFRPIVCADHVTSAKPDPEGLHTIRRLTSSSTLWYVGDTVDDARAARAAGVKFIGVAPKPQHRRDELIHLFEEEGTIAVVENVNELEKVL